MQLKKISDYYEIIKNKYPTVSDLDIKRILNFGWKQVYLLNSYGGDTLIKNKLFWMFTGTLTNDSIKHFHYYIKKLGIKLRVLYRRKKIQWDGYYYFALTEELYNDYLKLHNTKGRKRKYFKFGKLFLYKIYDECKIKQFHKPYIFKISFPVDCGMTMLQLNLISDKAELVTKRTPMTFKDILVSNNNYLFL